MHPVQHPPPGVMSGQAGPGVSRGFKAVEDVYLSFKDVKDVIQHSLVYLIPLTTNHS